MHSLARLAGATAPIPPGSLVNQSPLYGERPAHLQLAPAFSLYLDLLRFLAALLVYVAHAGHFAQARLPLLGRHGSHGVIVFFVLSGFVIAFTARRRHASVGDYMVARLARLWSIALPAILLTMLLDLAGQQLSMAAYAPLQPYTPFKWAASAAASALFLNQVWWFDIWLGSNGPYWSLSYEFWYYAIFAPLIYFRGAKRLVWTAAAALVAGPGILVALPVWLVGVGLYHALHHASRRAPAPGRKTLPWLTWLISALLLLAYMTADGRRLFSDSGLVFPLTGLKQWGVGFWPESYLLGMLVGLHLYGFARMQLRRLPAPRIAGLLRAAAEASFGLYLFHYPLMLFIKALLFKLGAVSGPLYVGAIYLLPLALSVWLALLCEPLKKILAARLQRLVRRAGRSATGQAGAAALPE